MWRVSAGRTAEKWGDRLFTLSYYIVEKIGSNRTSKYIDGLIHSVSAGSPTLSQFDDWDTQIQTPYYCITEAYSVLTHWCVVYAILLLCWSTACFITLLSFTQHFYIAELYPILIHCWSIPYLITLLSISRILIHYWAIPNPNTSLRYSLTQNIAEQFPISIHTALYPILTHFWGIPYLITLLSNSQIKIHCWAIPNPNTMLEYTLSYYIAKQFSNTNTLVSYTQSLHLVEVNQMLIHCWFIPDLSTSSYHDWS